MFLELTVALLSSQMAATSALAALEDVFLRAFPFLINKMNDEGDIKVFDVWYQIDLCMIVNKHTHTHIHRNIPANMY